MNSKRETIYRLSCFEKSAAVDYGDKLMVIQQKSTLYHIFAAHLYIIAVQEVLNYASNVCGFYKRSSVIVSSWQRNLQWLSTAELPYSKMMKSPTNLSASSGKPTAGESFPFFAFETDGDHTNGAPDTWSKCNPSTFNTRVGPDYSKNKRKEPSAGSLMEIVGVE